MTYTINEANEISINQDPPHFGFEFYPENYEKLYRCVCTLAKYLDSEVSNTSNQLMSRLNEEQLVALRAERKEPAHTRKTTKPIDYREPKAKIPKSGNGEPA